MWSSECFFCRYKKQTCRVGLFSLLHHRSTQSGWSSSFLHCSVFVTLVLKGLEHSCGFYISELIFCCLNDQSFGSCCLSSINPRTQKSVCAALCWTLRGTESAQSENKQWTHRCLQRLGRKHVEEEDEEEGYLEWASCEPSLQLCGTRTPQRRNLDFCSCLWCSGTRSHPPRRPSPGHIDAEGEEQKLRSERHTLLQKREQTVRQGEWKESSDFKVP